MRFFVFYLILISLHANTYAYIRQNGFSNGKDAITRKSAFTKAFIILMKAEEDYLAGSRNFSSDHWDTLRAARLSAAVKRFKTSEMLRFILEFVVPRTLRKTPPIWHRFRSEAALQLPVRPVW